MAILALVSGGAALWITLRAHFLAYPGWLAVQKADFIGGPIAVGLYCCLEAIQNTVKHAGPNPRASIRLTVNADQLRLEVQDDGPGFDTSTRREGRRLQNMNDRMGAVDGWLTIESILGRGTLMTAAVPIR